MSATRFTWSCPAKTNRSSVSAINDGKDAVAGEMRVQLESYDGSKQEFKQPVQLGGGANATLTIPRDRLGVMGIKWVGASLVGANNKTLDEEKLSFAYIHPAGPIPLEQQQMPIAIAYGANPDNNSELAAQAVSRAGITMHRAPIYWQEPEPRWDIRLKTVDVHAKYGVKPYFLISGTPGWALRVPDKQAGGNGQPPKLDLWTKFLRQLGEKFVGQKIYWEMWNEPGHSGFSRARPTSIWR